jgi:hypothetical protein
VALSQRSRPEKPEDVDAPHRKSKRTKRATGEYASTAPLLHGDLLSVADFDESKREIKYSCFVQEGLVDPPGRVNKKNVWFGAQLRARKHCEMHWIFVLLWLRSILMEASRFILSFRGFILAFSLLGAPFLPK